MDNSLKPSDYWAHQPFEHKVARKKWDMLQFQGHHLVSSNEYGIRFKKHREEVYGFIDWWGKVTWEID